MNPDTSAPTNPRHVSVLLLAFAIHCFKEIPMAKPQYQKLQTGDLVTLKTAHHVSRYWYEPTVMARGSYESHWLLPGCIGVIVVAETPCVTNAPGEPRFFANVDIDYMGEKHRVRAFHRDLERI